MSGKAMKIPGPDHPITIAPHEGRVTVSAGGKVIAETTHALVLKEATYPVAFYIPRDDANMALLSRTEHQTHCPYKGDASYYSLPTGADGVNGVWTYETPHKAVGEIKEYLAFYPNKVEIALQT